MNSAILSNIVRFFFLILLQVLLLNNINFFGYINPYLYVLFLILFPFNGNQTLFLFLSFLLGMGIDLFEDSGGINAAACLVVAYIRPAILRFSFGVSYDYQTVRFSSTAYGSRFSYVAILVFVHHFILFLLEIFSFAHLLLLLKKTFFSGIFTIVLVFLTLALFNKKIAMRKILLFIVIITTGIIFMARLFYLQIIDDSFAGRSENNAIKIEYDYPQRGYIFDRDGELLVTNQPSYDVMVIPRNVKPFDTTEFCHILNMTREQLVERLDKAKIYSPRLPSVVIPQLSKSEYAYLQEKMRKYEGFYIQKRSLRDYHTEHGASVLGFIAEVNQRTINENPYYISGDLIGNTGVEGYYEELLRGVKGVKYIQKDRFNREIGAYKEGIFDTLPQKGKDLTITIDKTLQEYGELLMTNKRGGIVAIEPETCEILALISAPFYDPAKLVGRSRSENYTRLYYDSIANPLYNRSLLAEYPPGSPFKTLNALIALQEGVVDTEDRFGCSRGYFYGRGRKMGCHAHPGPLSMIPGIAYSCNAYFANVYRRIVEKYPTPQQGIDVWKKHLESFGLGDYLGSDLSTGRPGKVPSADYYNNIYNYPEYKWYSTATLSNAIGQGEVLMTPMQLANMTAAIANRGWFYTPHILKAVEGNPIKDTIFTRKNHTTIDPEHFGPVVEGMHQVYTGGTASSLRIPGIEIAGKTGTAENFVRVNGKRMQLTDHSIFIAFAPVDNPKIAIAVFVENGYWGGRYAGRIAGLMIEKYLKGEITRTDMENWILSHSLEEEYAKPYSGEPFRINI